MFHTRGFNVWPKQRLLGSVKLCKARLTARIASAQTEPILTVLMRVSPGKATFVHMNEAVIIGATGLVGKALLAHLENDGEYTRIHLIVRRKGISKHPKTIEHVVDFDDARSFPTQIAPRHVYCCLGTTIKKAGSQEAFKRVDHDYVIALAEHFLALGAQHFAVVSAVGADESARIFYSKVKGQMEHALRALGYAGITIVRPSLLGGKRDEFRFGERLSIAAFALLQWAFVGALRRYRMVYDHEVAAAMVEAVHKHPTGEGILESEMLPPLAVAYRKRMA